MPAPNPETRALDPLRKRRKRLRYDVVVGLLFGIFVAFLIRNNVHTAQTMWKSAMTIRELPLEDVLQARILKSCLPTENKKCNQYIPEGTKAQRVAIVSPPGRLAMALERMVDHANNQQLLEGDYEFIRTSHVPPYGYGKTHGLTKIIRLVPQPLILGVTDMLLHSRDPTSSKQSPVSLNDLQFTLRQLIRFHCRISHISAHTALLTIPLNEMILNPDQVVEQLRLFLGKSSDQPKQAHIVTAMEVHQTRKELKDETTAALQSIRTSAMTLLSQVVDADNVLEVLSNVLRHELRSTKNLTDWPCQSFWSVGEDSDPYNLPLESKRIAAALSPNCSATFSNCWVHRDLCEAKGDGPCKE